MIRTLLLLLAVSGGAAWAQPAAQSAAQPAAKPATAEPDPAELTGSNVPLVVKIAGKTYALEALTLRKPGTDKLPVALITHGSLPGNPRALGIGQLRWWADEMAHRGWLAVAVLRRGYGKSEGEAIDETGSCASPDPGSYLDHQADDLEAALNAIADRPDADMTRLLGIGHSAGGAAMLALAARNRPPLAAVINVSGGLTFDQLGPFRPDPKCDAYTSDMVWNFARFGATAHMPTLWLYAENDALFRPGLVSRMRAAYAGSGGKVDFVMLPPFADDGHKMFYAPGGEQMLLPEIDRFLRATGLPTWDPAPFAPLLARLPAAQRTTVDFYLRTLPTEKALAVTKTGQLYYSYQNPTLAAARAKLQDFCREKTGADCRILAEDFTPMPPDPAP